MTVSFTYVKILQKHYTIYLYAMHLGKYLIHLYFMHFNILTRFPFMLQHNQPSVTWSVHVNHKF